MKKRKNAPPRRPKLRVRSKGGKKRRRSDGGGSLGNGAGVFVGFERHCPEVAARELRVLTLNEPLDEIPAGAYAFTESYCAGSDCDCRRVKFHVQRAAPGFESTARTILQVNFGWEPLEFYSARVGGDDRMGRMMKGPAVDPMSLPCTYGDRLIELFEETCLSSRAFVDRISEHYRMFKESLP